MKSADQARIENPLAQEILAGRVAADDTITVTVRSEEFGFEKKSAARVKVAG